MQSESARMSSAAEAKFRIDAPNSKPRAVKVIALDHPSERVVKDLSQRDWAGASFFTASAFGDKPRQGESFAGWLSDLAGRNKSLIQEGDSAELVGSGWNSGRQRRPCGDGGDRGRERAGRLDHRRGVQCQAGDDDGAGAGRHPRVRRRAVE